MNRKATVDEVAMALDWLREAGGEELASLWAWECTPMPFGKPSIKQVWEAVHFAAGEVDIRDVLRRVYDEMARLSKGDDLESKAGRRNDKSK